MKGLYEFLAVYGHAGTQKPVPERLFTLIAAKTFYLSDEVKCRAQGDLLLRRRLRRVDEARVNPPHFRCRRVRHLHPLGFAADHAKFLALLRDP
jgi:hypothetical protein